MPTRIALAAVLALLCMLLPAAAQDWPSRPVRFIVPFPAGGSTDVGARVVAEQLARAFRQQFYVENRTGANGAIGIEAAAKSAPDGYTVLVATDAVVSNPHVFPTGIDPLKDLLPVIRLSRQPIVLAVHPSLQVTSLAEFVALAKRQPGMRYATGSGIGSPQHMVVQWFARIAGLSLEQVPYRGGAQAINDLIAGHVTAGSLGSTPLIPHYKTGALRLLAQTTEARSPALPDVPTFQEAGMQGLVVDQWLGVFLPAGTPATIVARLNGGIDKALTEQTVRDSLLQSAQEPVGGSAADFSAFVRDEYAKYARLVKELNIKAPEGGTAR